MAHPRSCEAKFSAGAMALKAAIHLVFARLTVKPRASLAVLPEASCTVTMMRNESVLSGVKLHVDVPPVCATPRGMLLEGGTSRTVNVHLVTGPALLPFETTTAVPWTPKSACPAAPTVIPCVY